MKLYALSDLHIGHETNLQALQAVPHHPHDWLILGGDVCETEEELEACLHITTQRFARVFWVPGNHELWTLSESPSAPRGEAKYRRLVELCRRYGVSSPEDEYVKWPGPGPACTIVPQFTLYDYSFRGDAVPRDLPADEAVDYSRQRGIVCADEDLLHSDPYPDRAAWCRERIRYSEQRLEEQMRSGDTGPFVLINHYPLREEIAGLPAIPPFILWCGSRATEDWHRRFPVHTVAFGHIHIRRDRRIDGVRFVECSVGYPRQWDPSAGMQSRMVEILPGPN